MLDSCLASHNRGKLLAMVRWVVPEHSTGFAAAHEHASDLRLHRARLARMTAEVLRQTAAQRVELARTYRRMASNANGASAARFIDRAQRLETLAARGRRIADDEDHTATAWESGIPHDHFPASGSGSACLGGQRGGGAGFL